MKWWKIHSLALLFLWAVPSFASSICAQAVVAAPFEVGGDWEGTGLSKEIFEKWLQALPNSPVGERVAQAAISHLAGWSEWEIAQAINAGLKERTPHDRLEPAAAEKRSDTPQKRIGLGIEYSFYRNIIVIERVVEDSPAAHQGLKLGDQIEQFEEWAVSQHGVRKTAMQISVSDYSENKPVKLVVRRGQQLLNFELTPRSYVPHPDMRIGMLQPGRDLVGVITLHNFRCTSVEREFARGLDAFRKAKVDGLILDLRGNPGGRLDVARKLAGYFLGKKKLVISEEPLVAGARPADHFTDAQSRIQVPMLILVDYASASAAELLAGVLQFYQVAYLVGTPTYGKGSIQSSDTPESSVFEGLPVTLYATRALYYLPCGRTPQHRGLLPDFEVQQPFPTRAQYLPREQELRNSVAVPPPWDPGLAPDPLRDWLRNSPRTPRMQLPDGDIQKEVALKILSEWIALNKLGR
jgi:carboxyl-terminal processing protease